MKNEKIELFWDEKEHGVFITGSSNKIFVSLVCKKINFALKNC